MARYAGISSAVYFLAQLIDLGTTYLLSPDLRFESNVMIAKFGFGWSYLLISALLFSLVMVLIQIWMWRRLNRHLPDEQMAYTALYRRLLLGGSDGSSSQHETAQARGATMGVAFVAAYAAIASKAITCAWNVMLIAGSAPTHPPLIVTATKSFLAAGFGLFMFFVVPFWLHRRQKTA
ncbi:MAG: hypothetical protein P8Y52_08010 [Xanthomonadales bacterium]